MNRTKHSLLLLCYFDPQGIATIPENINLKRFSKFNIHVLNFFKYQGPYYKIPPEIDITHYKGIVIHNTISYNLENLRYLDSNLNIHFRDYQGLKILFKQDEQFNTRQVAEYIGHNKFDLIFTCLKESERHKVYPEEIVGNIKFYQMLTGYVTPKMRQFSYPLEGRKIDIGYRGSIQPLIFGQLAYEKRKIGYDVRVLAKQKGLVVDISSRWEDRKKGDEWYNFLGNCKAVLGVESGANIFDLDGSLEKRFLELKSTYQLENENDPEVAERILELLESIGEKIDYNQISPRHFEAVATKTLQILYEGEYSNILKPWVHYVPLKKDYSNFDEVYNFFSSEENRTAIVEQAYQDIILKHDYWIENFAKHFDTAIDKIAENKKLKYTINIRSTKRSKHFLFLDADAFSIKSHFCKIKKKLANFGAIHLLAINNLSNDIDAKQMQDGTLRVTAPHNYDTQTWLEINEKGYCPAQLELARLTLIANAEENLTSQFLKSIDKLNDFHLFVNHFVYVNSTLFSLGCRFQNVSAIIACDFDTLPAGIMLKNLLKIPLIYDIYRPSNPLTDFQYPNNFWNNMEKRLLPFADLIIKDNKISLLELMKLGKVYNRCAASFHYKEYRHSSFKLSLKKLKDSIIIKKESKFINYAKLIWHKFPLSIRTKFGSSIVSQINRILKIEFGNENR
ncbi:hypothetical protein [Candidatus Coxiella mudrowiae]|uniref:hypothetical protein n=1 Tax=Candidatus Coxiella mudrowiae TaxID=2054173 RepID=UPI000C293949|nr:hypothetical protein [Candidatus Coxiella mudrowiae]